MTKAARVAQGGSDGPRIQGIGGQFRTIPTIYRPNENRRPGMAGAAGEWQECLRRLFLKLALQRLHFLGQRGVLGDQGLDLAHGVQHRGVVAPAEAAADLGE